MVNSSMKDYQELLSSMGLDPSLITYSSERTAQISKPEVDDESGYIELLQKNMLEEDVEEEDNDADDSNVKVLDDINVEDEKEFLEKKMSMVSTTEQILQQISAELKIPMVEARYYVNNMFSFLRGSMSKLEFTSYYLYNFGTFDAVPVRGKNAELANEAQYKINKKGLKKDPDYNQKEELITTIKTYDPMLLLYTTHKRCLLFSKGNKKVLGFSYKKLYKHYTVLQLKELIEFLVKLKNN